MSKQPQKRYAIHLANLQRCNSPSKYLWIQELLNQGIMPILSIAEASLTKEEAQEKEVYWIQHYLKVKAPLTNIDYVTRKIVGLIKPTAPVNPTTRKRRMSRKEVSLEGSTILDLKEVATILKVTERTVLRLVEQKELEAFKVGNRWRFRRSEVEAYIDAQTRKLRDDH